MLAAVRVRGNRVHVRSTAGRHWEESGRHHFLTRGEFNAFLSRAGKRQSAMGTRRGRTMDGVARLAMLTAVLVAMWRVTVWVFPPAEWMVRWGWRSGKKLASGFVKRLRAVLWSWPARQLGWARTVWLWMLGLALATSVLAVMGWEPLALVAAVAFWGMVIGSWWYLRWWAQRRFQPHDLPARRVRVRR